MVLILGFLVEHTNLQKRKSSKTTNEVCGILIGKKINKNKYQITHLVYDDEAISPSPISITRNTKNIVVELFNLFDIHLEYFGGFDLNYELYSMDYASRCVVRNENNYKKEDPNYTLNFKGIGIK